MPASSSSAPPPYPGASPSPGTGNASAGSGSGAPRPLRAPPETPPLPGATTSEPKPAAVPATVGGLVDETMVVVEDVLDDEDEEEDVVDEDEDEDAARSGRPSPSSLSAHAPPFFPAHRLAGRSKFRRWEDNPGAGSFDDELASSAARSSYLDATRRALRATPPPPAGAPDAAQSAVEGTHPVPARGKRRRRCRTAAPNGRGTQPLNAARVPAQRRLGSQPTARVPVHQRLGPRRTAPVLDTSRRPHRRPNVRIPACRASSSSALPEEYINQTPPPRPAGARGLLLQLPRARPHRHSVSFPDPLPTLTGYRPSCQGMQECSFASRQPRPSPSVARRPSWSAFRARRPDGPARPRLSPECHAATGPTPTTLPCRVLRSTAPSSSPQQHHNSSRPVSPPPGVVDNCPKVEVYVVQRNVELAASRADPRVYAWLGAPLRASVSRTATLASLCKEAGKRCTLSLSSQWTVARRTSLIPGQPRLRTPRTPVSVRSLRHSERLAAKPREADSIKQAQCVLMQKLGVIARSPIVDSETVRKYKSTFQTPLSASKQEALQLLFGGDFDSLAMNFDMVEMDEV
ncbi:unnamed protein product [Miscanthus lutarioriparius]|uniref:Uncharacterized protein n=1 Tax=Miscanthus lutarioriparius TaxID=422564 RepID=A0A811PSB8_9POAL|nr:unnamed protein product [Miscanthus lutarioriparius]